MEQFDQLLTCCICLDRYRTPKLLPCQHSYCLDPCMEGLVDYVKRQVKCPECRAEHRIPYNGIQGFPTNYTLTKFLELHAEITGELPDPNADQIMSRCNVCSEKAYVNPCAHCDKKCCDTCRDAHCDILKREISRVNNQIKRGVHRVEDALAQVERNQTQLKTNAEQVVIEIDEVHRRLSNALKERTDYLKSSVDKYLVSEMKDLKELKDNLDLEIANIHSNSDLMEKNLDDGTKWDDNELMDCKDIFIKMMDWIRNYEINNDEYSRKIRFTCHDTVNDIAKRILEIGDLRMMETNKTRDDDFESRSSGLSRSKSDHRLVSEFRRQEESSPPMRRRFGENRYSREANKSRTNFGRFGGDEEEDDTTTRSSRFRSRFLRGDDDDDSDRRKSLHMEDDDKSVAKKERNKVIETEDASRGPLSGCIRLADSSRVIQRLKEREMELIRPKKKETPPPVFKPVTRPVPPPAPRPTANNDDEIDRIKKENKTKETTQTATTTQVDATPASTTTSTAIATATAETTAVTAPATTATSPSSAAAAAAAVRRQSTTAPEPVAPVRPSRASSVSAAPTEIAAPPTAPLRGAQGSSVTGGSRYNSRATSPNSIVGRYTQQPGAAAAATSSYAGYGVTSPAKTQEASPDSDFSSSDSDSTTSSSSDSEDDDADDGYEYEYYDEEEPAAGATAAPAATGSTASRSILKKSAETPSYSSAYGASSSYGSSYAGNQSSYSGYGAGSSYGAGASAQPEAPVRNQSAYSGSTTSSYSRGDDQPSSSSSRTQRSYGGAKTTSSYGGTWGQDTETTAPASPSSTRRYSRYASPEPTVSSERRFSREESSDSNSGYVSRFKRRDDSDSFVSRYLAKSRSTAVGLGSSDSPKEETPEDSVSATRKISGELQYPSGRSRYAALKERKARIAKSKSSATIGLGDNDDDDNDEEVLTPFTSRFGGELARSRSSHLLKEQTPSSSRTSALETTADDENLSSWAKYLKNKYGGRGAASSAQTSSRETDRSSLTSRPGSGLLSSYERDQSKNATGSPAPTPQQPSGSAGIGSMPKSQYLNKQALVLKFGARGSQPGFFTWPRGIAVGADNTIIVADSSNHRVQIFDSQGQIRFWLGGYGNGEGEFDCLAGVAVNRIGQYIIADRYNHRIQIFDPSGQFIRTFGSQGTGNGEFNYPWGICTDALGFIYVCDKENHRVQVFQSDGTFVAKFGSMGNKPGQLEHPHYIAVSNTNRVIVSDSNNHRLQIFDVNGKVLTTFGSEGTDEGQFKFPRGVAVDEQGYIFVADSGNNRIQIFNPDGTFLRCFGRWGQADGEFKGLEGIAVNAAGRILVADRENHRIQIF